MKLRYIIIAIFGVALVAAASIFTYQYFADSQSTPPPASTAPAPETKPEPNPAKAEEPTGPMPIKVFFSKHPESDNDPSRVFAVSRTSPDTGVARAAIRELLTGPTQAERDQGYFSTIRLRDDASNCDGQDFTLSIDNGTATLQFCRTFDHLGSVADGQAESSLNATLMQFSSVDKVVILTKNGDCEFDLSGMNLCKEQ